MSQFSNHRNTGSVGAKLQFLNVGPVSHNSVIHLHMYQGRFLKRQTAAFHPPYMLDHTVLYYIASAYCRLRIKQH